MPPRELRIRAGQRGWVKAEFLALGIEMSGRPVRVATLFAGQAEAGPLKIAFAYVGPVGDGGWTYAHDNGRKAVEKEFGDKVITSIVEKVPEAADAERVFRDMIGQGNKLIFGTTFGYMEPMLKVAADAPPGVPLTTFSILFARHRGDLTEFVRGCGAIERLGPGDRVLIAEACSHHPSGEDIGRVKIPRWLTQYVGCALDFTTVSGRDFPADLASYKLVIHCGGCMLSRREVLARVQRCREAGVPITNYGMTIAYSLGVFERALGPFPGALEVYRAMQGLRPGPRTPSPPRAG